MSNTIIRYKLFISFSRIAKLFSLFFIVSLLMLSGCTEEKPKKVSLYTKGAADTGKTGHATPNTIWFGFDLRLGPKEEVKIYTPLLKYLEKTTGKRFRIRFTEKYEKTMENLGKGATNFAAIGSLSYVIGAEKYGIKYLVSGINKEGDPQYRSLIFTGPDSEINNIKDIKGKCFAFGSMMSTQGHLIPRKMLEDKGVTIHDLERHVYTGSHFNTVKRVLKGECQAGGIQDVLAKRLAEEGKIKIIEISKSYPSSVIAYNSAVDSSIVNAVRSALLEFDPTGKHKDILYDWDKTEMPLGFAEIDQLELNRVRELAKSYGLITE